MKRLTLITICSIIAVLGFGSGTASAGMVTLNGPDGLKVTADFTLISAVELEIILTNASTGVPGGFSNSDQLLTGLSFDLGGPEIISGDVIIGDDASDQSLNFDIGSLGNGADVSYEWGYGNNGSTSMLDNMVSVNTSHMTRFSNVGPNLDGPDGLDGPQGGLVADPVIVDLGGLGAIQNSVVITLNLSGAGVSDLGFLENGVIAEFGSDAAFVPEPVTIVLLGLGAISFLGRRKK